VSERVVVSLPDRANEFQALQAKQALEVGARLGFEVQIEYGDGSALEQIQQLFKHVHGGERPLALVASLARISHRILSAGCGLPGKPILRVGFCGSGCELLFGAQQRPPGSFMSPGK